MSFSTILFTEKGRALQAKAQAGTALNFTKLAMGSGSLGGQSQITLTALIDPKVILSINEIKRKPNYATIKGIFSNQDISTGFYWREIGLFAQDPDIGEILYCYGNAGTLAEYIPPQSSEIIEKVVSITAMIGDAATVTASIDESLVYVTKPELDAVSQKADQAFQSASNGKTAIKAAITGVDPEVTIPTDATFSELAAAIGQIKTGVDTEDATATAEQILSGMTAYVQGAKITGNMTNRGAVNITPGTANQAIPKGYHNGNGVVAGEPNLVSGNIKAGTSIFGKSGKSSVMDTADATGDALKILSGYNAYINGVKTEGTMNKNTFAARGDTGWIYATPKTDGAGNLHFQPNANGYYDINANSAGYGILKANDPDFIASNILNTANIFGLQGAATPGKKSQSGTATTVSGGSFENLLDTAYTILPYIVVSGLTFLPSYILISWTSYSSSEYTTVFDILNSANYLKKFKVAQYSSHNPVSPTTYAFKADARSAYVNSTGFLAPVAIGGATYNWIAIE